MRKVVVRIIICIAAILIVATCFSACNKADINTREIDYSIDNSFEVLVTETDNSLIFQPKDKDYKYGIIFYVGTFIAPDSYTHISELIAAQGFLVIIPKVNLNLAYINYNDIEAAFTDYPEVSFFVGGHSQGGGAAIRRAYAERERIIGAVLYSPLCYENDTLNDLEIPVLLIEAENDLILDATMKADALSRMPEEYTHITIAGSNHMGYCDDEIFVDGAQIITKEEMQNTVVAHTLTFMKQIINA